MPAVYRVLGEALGVRLSKNTHSLQSQNPKPPLRRSPGAHAAVLTRMLWRMSYGFDSGPVSRKQSAQLTVIQELRVAESPETPQSKSCSHKPHYARLNLHTLPPPLPPARPPDPNPAQPKMPELDMPRCTCYQSLATPRSPKRVRP